MSDLEQLARDARTMTDEELSRRLQEIRENRRNRPTTTRKKAEASSTPKAPRKKKETIVDIDLGDDVDLDDIELGDF